MRLRVTAVLLAAVSMAAITGPTFAQSPADTLTVTRLSDFPTCFHPICFQTGNQYMNFQLLFNSLVKVDSDESTFIPDLADTWEVSPDATTFTFHLNPKATWQDGTPVTADDVIYTAATAAQMADVYTTNGTYPIDDWLAVKGPTRSRAPATSPRAWSRSTTTPSQFTLAAPNAVWLRNLADPAYMIMPKHILEGIGRHGAPGQRLREWQGHHRLGPLQADRASRPTSTWSTPPTRTTSRARPRSRRSSSS